VSEHAIELKVNGAAVCAHVPAARLLADFLRDDLHLTGTKRGCETGICGACTVLIEGKPVKSCLSLAVMAKGKEVRTVEGLTRDGRLHPLQESFLKCAGLQCGYCTPGMLMSSCALLESNLKPDAQAVRAALAGNLCRCTGYTQIVESVLDAAEAKHGN
jgi:aerobic carbon-monoxide dehydrogenase small subunit